MEPPDTLDEDKERQRKLADSEMTPLKAAHQAANNLGNGAINSSSLTGVIQAILAVEQRIYWHGLVMQQRS